MLVLRATQVPLVMLALEQQPETQEIPGVQGLRELLAQMEI